jgi:hypothetical protein
MAGPMADVRAAFRQIGAVLLFRQRGMLIEQAGLDAIARANIASNHSIISINCLGHP